MAMGYTVVPDECGWCVQLHVQPLSWGGDSVLHSRLMDAPHVQHSLHLDCEIGEFLLALTERGEVFL